VEVQDANRARRRAHEIGGDPAKRALRPDEVPDLRRETERAGTGLSGRREGREVAQSQHVRWQHNGRANADAVGRKVARGCRRDDLLGHHRMKAAPQALEPRVRPAGSDPGYAARSLAISSVIFLASPRSIMVLSR